MWIVKVKVYFNKIFVYLLKFTKKTVLSGYYIMEKKLETLIKERSGNCPTYTKHKPANPELIQNELVSFDFIRGLGFLTPEVIYSTGTTFSTRYVSGTSVFRVLELLHKENDIKTISHILNLLCKSLNRIHNNTDLLNFPQTQKYDTETKIGEVCDFLEEENEGLANEIRERIPKIAEVFEEAKTPFFDRTPKNYIIPGVAESSIDTTYLRSLEQSDILYFDFTSTGDLTFECDDYVSLLFHYCVTDDLRKTLLEKYSIDLNSRENIVCTFVRLSRFWVRRAYYKKVHPEAYQKRYLYENFNYYQEKMFEYTDKMIRVI